MFHFLKSIFSPSISSIHPSELSTALKESNGILIDVRSPQEYRANHIKNAQNIPLQRIHTYTGIKSKPIYTICQSGMRSKKAAKILSQLGYKVINVTGGMSAYSKK